MNKKQRIVENDHPNTTVKFDRIQAVPSHQQSVGAGVSFEEEYLSADEPDSRTQEEGSSFDRLCK